MSRLLRQGHRSSRKVRAVKFHIPFNKPSVVGSELIYVGQAVAGGHASGDGPFTKSVRRN